MASQNQDSETKSEFQKRMTDTVNSGWVLAGLALGNKLGLFKVLAAAENPITSAELADKADCKERYVREWLHHQVMCDVVDVDVSGKMFTLPSHRREALTGDDQAVTTMSSAFSSMLIPHDEILSCFTKSGPSGVPFETVMPIFREFNGLKVMKPYELFSDLLNETVPDMQKNLDLGIKVLDLGCGFGNMLFRLAPQFPKSTFVGVDICQTLIDAAATEKAAKNLQNADFYCQDARDLPTTWYDSFDYVMMRDVLHDLPYPHKVLDSIHKCLKPGGLLSIIEMNVQENPYDSRNNPDQKSLGQLIYIISIYHCLAASMYHRDSIGLGAGPGMEYLMKLVQEANFTPLAEPKHCGQWNTHILFKK